MQFSKALNIRATKWASTIAPYEYRQVSQIVNSFSNQAVPNYSKKYQNSTEDVNILKQIMCVI